MGLVCKSRDLSLCMWWWSESRQKYIRQGPNTDAESDDSEGISEPLTITIYYDFDQSSSKNLSAWVKFRKIIT